MEFVHTHLSNTRQTMQNMELAEVRSSEDMPKQDLTSFIGVKTAENWHL